MFRVLLFILHVLLLLGMSCGAKKNHLCPASSCGEIHDIHYPFRLKSDPKHCGRSENELVCENNCTFLYLYAGRYYVKSINYSNLVDSFFGIITVVDDGLQKGNCSSLPRQSLARSNFSAHDPYRGGLFPSADPVVFMKCSQPVVSALYINTEPCIEEASLSDTPPNFSQMKAYSYALYGSDLLIRDIKDSCNITMITLLSSQEVDWYKRVSPLYTDLHNMMAEGFDLLYSEPYSSEIFQICAISFRYRMAWCNPYDSSDDMRLFALRLVPVAVLNLFFFLGMISPFSLHTYEALI
ncbi:uncharacterized protein LOC104416600 [Eucalyptus grandis]|uniref:uncharacterized protein LOC104416600 n=1 Tax=Eucalyptus grandis TaxID=71139 RepID=UPI00192F0120|nr:uncharacterized protein LOC104416600 [Eucalyptus grandis]